MIKGVHVKVRERDLGWDEILRTMKATKQINVKVGVVGADASAEHADDGLTNAQLAAIHEFGAPAAGIPERSFLRSTANLKRAEYVGVIAPRILRAVLERKISFWQAFELLGQRMAADVKMRITAGEGVPPPLAPETIRRKGSSRALVDTGRLVAAITYAVTLGALERVVK